MPMRSDAGICVPNIPGAGDIDIHQVSGGNAMKVQDVVSTGVLPSICVLLPRPIVVFILPGAWFSVVFLFHSDSHNRS